MIYTSCFSRINELPKNMITIAISLKIPEWYVGLRYQALAPKPDFFAQWKENHDNEFYIKNFNKRVLSEFEADVVYENLQTLAKKYIDTLPDTDIRKSNYNLALLCYEEHHEFCHRHLVADWFQNNGFNACEFEFN